MFWRVDGTECPFLLLLTDPSLFLRTDTWHKSAESHRKGKGLPSCFLSPRISALHRARVRGRDACKGRLGKGLQDLLQKCCKALFVVRLQYVSDRFPRRILFDSVLSFSILLLCTKIQLAAKVISVQWLQSYAAIDRDSAILSTHLDLT